MVKSLLPIPEETLRSLDYTSDTLRHMALTPDQDYNLRELEDGQFNIDIRENPENINRKGALEYLLKIDHALSEAGVSYAHIRFEMRDTDLKSNYSLYNVTPEMLRCSDPDTSIEQLRQTEESQREALRESWQKSGG